LPPRPRKPWQPRRMRTNTLTVRARNSDEQICADVVAGVRFEAIQAEPTIGG
jgi:hypothetical protein